MEKLCKNQQWIVPFFCCYPRYLNHVFYCRMTWQMFYFMPVLRWMSGIVLISLWFLKFSLENKSFRRKLARLQNNDNNKKFPIYSYQRFCAANAAPYAAPHTAPSNSSSNKDHHPSKVSSIKGHPPSKVALHKRSSFIKGSLSPKGVFHQKSCSIKGCLPSKVVLHQSLSSIKGCLP